MAPCNAAAGRKVSLTEGEDSGLDFLAALCPDGISRDFVWHVLHELHAGDLQASEKVSATSGKSHDESP